MVHACMKIRALAGILSTFPISRIAKKHKKRPRRCADPVTTVKNPVLDFFKPMLSASRAFQELTCFEEHTDCDVHFPSEFDGVILGLVLRRPGCAEPGEPGVHCDCGPDQWRRENVVLAP